MKTNLKRHFKNFIFEARFTITSGNKYQQLSLSLHRMNLCLSGFYGAHALFRARIRKPFSLKKIGRKFPRKLIKFILEAGCTYYYFTTWWMFMNERVFMLNAWWQNTKWWQITNMGHCRGGGNFNHLYHSCILLFAILSMS